MARPSHAQSILDEALDWGDDASACGDGLAADWTGAAEPKAPDAVEGAA